MVQIESVEVKVMAQTLFPGNSSGIISVCVLVVVVLGVTISAVEKNAAAKLKLAQKKYSIIQGQIETSNNAEISGVCEKENK